MQQISGGISLSFVSRRTGAFPGMRLFVLCAFGALLVSGCGQQTGSSSDSGEGSSTAEAPSASSETTGEGQTYPDILGAELEPSAGTYTLDVTVSSPYDSPERYADGWRVLSPDGTVLGEHELTHDHASEQPFTRTQSGLEIPDNVREITVEGRDMENGYGGGTVTIAVEG